MRNNKTSLLSRTIAVLLVAIMLVNVLPGTLTASAAEEYTEAASEEAITEAATEEELTEAATEEELTEPVSEEVITEATTEEKTDSENTELESCENGYLFKLTEDAAIPEEDSVFSHIGDLIYYVSTLELLYEYYSEDELVFVEENIELEFFDDPTDQYYSKQETYLSNTNAQSFWDSSYELNYSDVTIAIIDSGLSESHEDFVGNNVTEGKNYSLSDTEVIEGTDTSDTSGHGTQVAGIISAIQNNGKGITGLINGAEIVPLRVSNDAGTLVMGTVAKAIYDAVDIYGADAINLSLGTSTQSDTLDVAVAYAISKGAIVVAAAGNNGNDTLIYPAACDGVIGVGAVDNDNTVRDNSQRNESVFVTAPGESIYSLSYNNRYAVVSGTSFSAPFVTAMAASARAYNPDITNDEFQQLLIETSADKGDEGYDTSYGYGVIDVEKFLNQLTEYESGTPLEFLYDQDYGSELNDYFYAVEQTKDGGYVAVGSTFAASTNPEWSFAGTSSTNNDAIIVIFDSDMNVIWSTNFGTTGVDIFNDVTVLSDGTIIAVGRSPHAFAEGVSSTASGYLVTINPETYEYTETYIGGDKGGDYLEAIEATSDGGYAIAGRVSSYDSEDFTKIHNSSTKADGVILKYSADGTRQFSKCYSSVSDYSTYFYNLAVDNDGNLVAVGYHQIGKYLYNSDIAKFDGNNGDLLWSKSVGTNKTEAPSSSINGHISHYEGVAVLNDGTYVVAGYTQYNGSDTEENWGLTGDIDGIIVRYQPDGTFISSKNIGEISAEVEFDQVIATEDGGYLVIGATAYDVSGLWTIAGSSDPVILKYDKNHHRVWAQSYGSANNSAEIADMVEYENGAFMAVGTSNWSRDTHKDNVTVWNTKYFEKDGGDDQDQDTTIYTDGVYTGTAQGYGGTVTVQVTITDGVITDVTVTSHTETDGYMPIALAVIESIINQQSASVDSISGATVSSNAIKSAVTQALLKAVKEEETETESETETKTKTYSIKYVLNGGTNSASNKSKYTAGESFTLASPTRAGYNFDGWYTESSFKTKATKVTAGTSGNLTFYAKWSAAKYKITFKANGGTKLSSSSKNVTYAGTYGTMPTVQRKNYTFKGWYTAKTGGTKVTSGTKVSITKAQTLYAQWTKVTKPAKAKIKSVKNTKSKKITVKIKKVSGAAGYQILYSTSKKFKPTKKTTTTSLSKTIKKLKKGKTYYVKVRAYKKDSAGNKIYGSYSTVKQAKIKK